MLTSVLLPAPLSPIRPITSPARSSQADVAQGGHRAEALGHALDREHAPGRSSRAARRVASGSGVARARQRRARPAASRCGRFLDLDRHALEPLVERVGRRGQRRARCRRPGWRRTGRCSSGSGRCSGRRRRTRRRARPRASRGRRRRPRRRAGSRSAPAARGRCRSRARRRRARRSGSARRRPPPRPRRCKQAGQARTARRRARGQPCGRRRWPSVPAGRHVVPDVGADQEGRRGR